MSTKHFYIEIAITGFLLLLIATLKLSITSPEDFCPDYYAAKHFINHVSAYSPVPCFKLHYSAHPPLAILLFVPFTLLPFEHASLIWGIISLGFYIGAGILLLKKAGWFSMKSVAIFLLFSVFWPSFLLATHYHNTGQLLLFLIILSWTLKQTRFSYLSGIMLGFASLIKIWPVILLVGELFVGKKRVAIPGFITILLGFIISLVMVGYTTYFTYFTSIRLYEQTWLTHPSNLSIIGMLGKLFTGYSSETQPIITQLATNKIFSLGYVLSIVFTCAVFMFLYWFKNKYKIKHNDKDLFIEGILLTVSFLVFPLSWDWSIILLLLPCVVILTKIHRFPEQPKWWYIFFLTGVFVLINPLAIFDHKTVSIKLATYVLFTASVMLFLIYQMLLVLHIGKVTQENESCSP